MARLEGWIVVACVLLVALTAAGPALVALAQAAVPMVIAIGSVCIAGRIVWYFTGRY